MTVDLADWKGAPLPRRIALEGRYARLEPLEARHARDLYQGAAAPGAPARFRYLPEHPPRDAAEFDAWMAKAVASDDPLFFAVVDRRTWRAEGRQALMRIVPNHGVIEVGNVLWGPAIARTRVATEALYLFARHVFEDLGYRRFEWKCNAFNEPSRRAALRFGFRFEGIFRRHMVVKGESRDTAWFAMTDADWPAIAAGFLAWLEPDNFDEAGKQRNQLKVCGT
jgi:RimJ/RimL family protein N-acetyltransferase